MAEGDTRRLFEAVDVMGQRLARMEAMLEARNKVCDMQDTKITKLEIRVSLLERCRSVFSGGLGFAAWVISTIIMMAGVFYR